MPPLLLQPDALIVVQERLRGVWRTLRLLLGVLHDGPDREVGRVRLIGRWQWLIAVVHVVERRDQVVDRIADRHVGAKFLLARREEVDRRLVLPPEANGFERALDDLLVRCTRD